MFLNLSIYTRTLLTLTKYSSNGTLSNFHKTGSYITVLATNLAEGVVFYNQINLTVYLGPCQRSPVKFIVKIVNALQLHHICLAELHHRCLTGT